MTLGNESVESTGINRFVVSFGLWFLLALFLISYTIFINIAASPEWDTDYKYLYFSATQAWQHANIYDTHAFFSPSLQGMTQTVNLNPPLLAVMMMPFALLPYTTSFWIWSILNILLAVASTILIVRVLFRPTHYLPYLASTVALLAYFPTFINFYAQTGAFVYGLITLGWLAYREKKWRWAGFYFGLAFSFKVFVGLFLWLFFCHQAWRTLRAFLVTATGCAAFSILVLGTAVYQQYAAIFTHVHWYAASWNASLWGFLVRLLGYAQENYLGIVHFPALSPWLYVGIVMCLLSSFYYFRKLSDTDLAVSYTIILMLLISPLAWIYYFWLLWIPGLIMLSSCLQRSGGGIGLGLASALLLSSMPHLLIKPHQLTHAMDVFFWSGTYTYALILLAMMVFHLQKKVRLQQPCAIPVGLQDARLGTQNDPKSVYMTLAAALLPSGLATLTYIDLIRAAQWSNNI